jgi:hypothetical protein
MLEGRLSLRHEDTEIFLDPGGCGFLPARELPTMACGSKTRCSFYVSWDGDPKSFPGPGTAPEVCKAMAGLDEAFLHHCGLEQPLLELIRTHPSPDQVHSLGSQAANYAATPWHFLYFLPLPHGHGSLRPTFGAPPFEAGLEAAAPPSFPMN